MKMGISDKINDIEREFFFGRLIPKKFLESLETHLPEIVPGREEEIMTAITDRIGPLTEANNDVFDDEAGNDLVKACSTVLAAYRVLEPIIGDEQKTIELLRHVFSHFGARSTKFATRLIMSVPGSKLNMIERYFQTSEPMLGEAWDVSWTRDGDQFFEMKFTACGFHKFFAANGVPVLTTVFCAWDALWIQQIDPDRDGVEATRPATLGYGGDACYFQFRNVAAGKQGNS